MFDAGASVARISHDDPPDTATAGGGVRRAAGVRGETLWQLVPRKVPRACIREAGRGVRGQVVAQASREAYYLAGGGR